MLLLATQALAQVTPIEVQKTNGWGCCLTWMEPPEGDGFAPNRQDMLAGLLVRFKLDNGVPQQIVFRHTAPIEGYMIVRYMPASDIIQLLIAQRLGAVRPAVLKIPLGSPSLGQGRRLEA